MITTLTGANIYMLQQELRLLTDNFVTEYTDMGLERFDGEELEVQRLPSIVQSLPFLVARRMAVLRQPSAQKVVVEQLEKLLDEVPETTDLVIVEPSLDKRTSYYKALQKKTDFRIFEPLSEQALAKWLVAEATKQSSTLSLGDATYLIQRVGHNQLTLANEVTKLAHYDSKITKQTIGELTDSMPQSSVFDLLDAAFAGNTQKVLALYQEQRQQKVEPLAIMAMITWQLHILAVIKTAGSRSSQEVATQAKISPYVVRKSSTIATKVSLPTLKTWIHEAYQLDVRLKSQPIDPDEALQQFLLSLTD